MGPPCEANSFSDFSIFTIFVVKFCIWYCHDYYKINFKKNGTQLLINEGIIRIITIIIIMLIIIIIIIP